MVYAIVLIMRNTQCVYKSIGDTPLDAVTKFKKHNPSFLNEKISYAGRLDPMAEGLLLLLIGDENKNRSSYELMEKTYEFSVLFGIETDSYDILGIPTLAKISTAPSQEQILSYIDDFPHSLIQPFPPFSSKPVNGIPLYRLSRQQKVSEEELPTKKVFVYSFTHVSSQTINSQELLQYITNNISLIHGNFRQEDILKSWNSILSTSKASYIIHSFCLSCSSGTYVRSIAHYMGKHFQTSALAFSIKRSAIGPYTLP